VPCRCAAALDFAMSSWLIVCSFQWRDKRLSTYAASNDAAFWRAPGRPGSTAFEEGDAKRPGSDLDEQNLNDALALIRS